MGLFNLIGPEVHWVLVLLYIAHKHRPAFATENITYKTTCAPLEVKMAIHISDGQIMILFTKTFLKTTVELQT